MQALRAWLVPAESTGARIRTLRAVHLTTGVAGGLFTPYLSLLLVHDGLTSGQIGWVMSIGTLVSILSQPFWGLLVDRYRISRVVLVLSTVVPGVIAFLYDAPWLWTLVVASVLSTLMSTPQVPVVNVYTVLAAREGHTSYGAIRLFGSIGFAVGGYLGGVLVERLPIADLWLPYAAMSVAGGLAALRLPEPDVSFGVNAPLREGVGELVRNRRFLVFLLGGFLISQTLTAFNTYFAIAYHAIGGSLRTTGFAFMLASATNVPAMLLATRVIGRLGRGRTMALAALAYVIRWGVQAILPLPPVAIAVQVLHGISFGFFYVAAVDYVSEAAREEVQTTGQSLFNMASGGLAGIAGNLLNGYLLNRGGPGLMFSACAVSSAAGAVCLALVARRPRVAVQALAERSAR